MQTNTQQHLNKCKEGDTISLLVVICTHNPKSSVLQKTINGLKEQTVAPNGWDLVVVDNASTNAFAGTLDLSWHPNAKVVSESELGTSNARRRAFNYFCSGGYEILLFVDDDTVLDPNYIEDGMRFAVTQMKLGCWGGQLLPEYEVNPPDWLKPFEKYLAVSEISNDIISYEFSGDYGVCPPTAGMFTTRKLVEGYLLHLENNPLCRILGAKGEILTRGEDTDFALYAMNAGFGVARISQISLRHMIPEERTTLSYLSRLMFGISAGTVLLEYIHFNKIPDRLSWVQWFIFRWRLWRLPEVNKVIYGAEVRGREYGRQLILSNV